MMRYKRNESFRYIPGTPIQAKLTSLDGTNHDAQILDLSLEGVRMETGSTIFELGQETKLNFKLNETEIAVTGTIVWHKPTFNFYGLQLDIDEDEKKLMLTEIKSHAKDNSRKK